MPFTNTEQRERKEFQKVNYLKLNAGNHVVRFIEKPEDARLVYTHYVGGKYTVECLGDDCPVCDNNKKIIFEHPEDFRDVPGYSPQSRRFLINVLDRTLVKVCPSCQEEVVPLSGKNYPATCPACRSFLTDVAPVPSNKVKLLSFGVELAQRLNSIESSICDVQGDPVGLTNFDIVFAVEGAGRKKVTTPIAAANRNDPVDVPEEAFQDKDNAVMHLEANEILDLLRGVSLKDIYASRRSKEVLTSEAVTEALTDVKSSAKEDVKSAIDSILDSI